MSDSQIPEVALALDMWRRSFPIEMSCPPEVMETWFTRTVFQDVLVGEQFFLTFDFDGIRVKVSDDSYSLKYPKTMESVGLKWSSQSEHVYVLPTNSEKVLHQTVDE